MSGFRARARTRAMARTRARTRTRTRTRAMARTTATPKATARARTSVGQVYTAPSFFVGCGIKKRNPYMYANIINHAVCYFFVLLRFQVEEERKH